VIQLFSNVCGPKLTLFHLKTMFLTSGCGYFLNTFLCADRRLFSVFKSNPLKDFLAPVVDPGGTLIKRSGRLLVSLSVVNDRFF